MECRAYGICLDSQSRGYLGKDRKESSAAGGNLSRMHKTQETAKESRLNFMYSHLRNRTLVPLRGWCTKKLPGTRSSRSNSSPLSPRNTSWNSTRTRLRGYGIRRRFGPEDSPTTWWIL